MISGFIFSALLQRYQWYIGFYLGPILNHIVVKNAVYLVYSCVINIILLLSQSIMHTQLYSTNWMKLHAMLKSVVRLYLLTLIRLRVSCIIWPPQMFLRLSSRALFQLSGLFGSKAIRSFGLVECDSQVVVRLFSREMLPSNTLFLIGPDPRFEQFTWLPVHYDKCNFFLFFIFNFRFYFFLSCWNLWVLIPPPSIVLPN